MCPLCEKRRAKRFCPAQGEAICAPCCGSYREVTLDCPLSCPHLRASRAHGARETSLEPPPPVSPELRLPPHFGGDHEDLLRSLCAEIGGFWAESPALSDPDLLDVLRHVAQTWAAQRAGVVFESHPTGALREGLYRRLQDALREYRPPQRGLAAPPPQRAEELEMAVVYLARLVRLRANGRPGSRLCLEWLAPEAPHAATQPVGSLIVAP